MVSKLDLTYMTPAPWKVSAESGSASYSVYADCDGYSIAAVWAKKGHYRPTPESTRRARANAHLMAAAPELYQVLDAALICLRNRDQSPHEAHVVAAAKVALAKARGEL